MIISVAFSCYFVNEIIHFVLFGDGDMIARLGSHGIKNLIGTVRSSGAVFGSISRKQFLYLRVCAVAILGYAVTVGCKWPVTEILILLPIRVRVSSTVSKSTRFLKVSIIVAVMVRNFFTVNAITMGASTFTSEAMRADIVILPEPVGAGSGSEWSRLSARFCHGKIFYIKH